MSDTYRPNEFVKRKHLADDVIAPLINAFNISTGNTTARNPTIRNNSTATDYDGVLMRIGWSNLTLNNANGVYTYTIQLPTGLRVREQPSVTPHFEFANLNPATVAGLCTFSCNWNSSSYNWTNWTVSIGMSNATEKTACPITYTIKLSIPAGDGFQAYSSTINVEIYDDTEG